MKIKRMGSVCIRTPEIDRMTWFFRDVLGFERLSDEESATFTRLPTNSSDLIELFAPQHADEKMMPGDVDYMVSFVVEDLHEAHDHLQAAGLELVGEMNWASPTLGWFFVRSPDGRVFAFEQLPD